MEMERFKSSNEKRKYILLYEVIKLIVKPYTQFITYQSIYQVSQTRVISFSFSSGVFFLGHPVCSQKKNDFDNHFRNCLIGMHKTQSNLRNFERQIELQWWTQTRLLLHKLSRYNRELSGIGILISILIK